MAKRHSIWDDLQGLGTGLLLVALALQLFAHAGLITGGVSGLSLLVHYATRWDYGWVLFVMSLPFYVFAWRTLGREFTIKTFVCVALLSVLVELMPRWISFGSLAPWFAGLMGGLLAGVGILALIRHRASLGGVGVLALYLQQRYHWRAGHIQLALDVLILLSGVWLLSWTQLLLSLLGAVALNLVIAINHRPGRYMGM